MTDSKFEQGWRRRFVERGENKNDDAGIAGWTTTGLKSRIRQFRHIWQNISRPRGIWLDIGCGAGSYTRILQSEGHQAIGLDYSSPSVKKARDRSPEGIFWLAANIYQLPFSPGNANGVLCFGVMQALAHPDTALKEMSRVLKPGGEIWLDALNAGCLPTRLKESIRRLSGRPPHLRYDVRSDLVAKAEAAELEMVTWHWMPLTPGRLSWLQPLVESAPMRLLFRKLPWIGSAFSHSFVLQLRRQKID